MLACMTYQVLLGSGILHITKDRENDGNENSHHSIMVESSRRFLLLQHSFIFLAHEAFSNWAFYKYVSTCRRRKRTKKVFVLKMASECFCFVPFNLAEVNDVRSWGYKIESLCPTWDPRSVNEVSTCYLPVGDRARLQLQLLLWFSIYQFTGVYLEGG